MLSFPPQARGFDPKPEPRNAAAGSSHARVRVEFVIVGSILEFLAPINIFDEVTDDFEIEDGFAVGDVRVGLHTLTLVTRAAFYTFDYRASETTPRRRYLRIPREYMFTAEQLKLPDLERTWWSSFPYGVTPFYSRPFGFADPDEERWPLPDPVLDVPSAGRVFLNRGGYRSRELDLGDLASGMVGFQGFPLKRRYPDDLPLFGWRNPGLWILWGDRDDRYIRHYRHGWQVLCPFPGETVPTSGDVSVAPHDVADVGALRDGDAITFYSLAESMFCAAVFKERGESETPILGFWQGQELRLNGVGRTGRHEALPSVDSRLTIPSPYGPNVVTVWVESTNIKTATLQVLSKNGWNLSLRGVQGSSTELGQEWSFRDVPGGRAFVCFSSPHESWWYPIPSIGDDPTISLKRADMGCVDLLRQPHRGNVEFSLFDVLPDNSEFRIAAAADARWWGRPGRVWLAPGDYHVGAAYGDRSERSLDSHWVDFRHQPIRVAAGTSKTIEVLVPDRVRCELELPR